MKKYILAVCMAVVSYTAQSQLTMPANGGSTKAMVGETVGITDVTIHYGRPALRGRDGKIWGLLVHEGFMDDSSFGVPRKMPWRAGANENTTIEFSTDVLVEGQKLKAGKYGFHVAYHPDECVLIFSNNTEGWGSYHYDEKDDALRVKVKPVSRPNVMERLTYTFSDQTDSSAVVAVEWEKLAIPFTVSTNLTEVLLANIEKEMNGTKSFDPQSYITAANFYYANNVNMDRALDYSKAAYRIFHNFNTAYLQYNILQKMNNTRAADSVMNEALANATMMEKNRYGRILISEKNPARAMEIFKQNHAKYPNEFVTNVGMARGYSATGDYKKALQYADKALGKAPDERNKQAVQKMISTLKEGKDINS